MHIRVFKPLREEKEMTYHHLKSVGHCIILMRHSAQQLEGVFSCRLDVLNRSFCLSSSSCACCQNCCCGPLLHYWSKLLWMKRNLLSQSFLVSKDKISWHKGKWEQGKPTIMRASGLTFFHPLADSRRNLEPLFVVDTMCFTLFFVGFYHPCLHFPFHQFCSLSFAW